MSNYRLIDDGYPTFKKIIHNRKWVGRVAKVKTGYMGIIGKTEFTAATEREAFAEVVARHLGYDCAAALDRKNRQVRAHNREARTAGRHAADEALRGNFDPLFRAMGFNVKEKK